MTQLTGQPGQVLDLPSRRAGVTWRTLIGDLSQLTKPRITLMVVITTWIGYALGADALARTGSLVSHGSMHLISTLIGTALSCMGACALNQVLERDTDLLMRRTRNRPVATGRISPAVATLMGLVLSLLGIGLLAVVANPLTAGLSAFTILSYALIYTPLKRVSHLCTIVGAAPGALPPVMGFAAATGALGVVPAIMFAILFLWQLPHFLAIAWLYRDEYAAAGLPMLPVNDPNGDATFRQILVGCMALLPLGLMPTVIGMTGIVYFVGALLAGLAFLAFGIALARHRTRGHARALFFASLVYLPLVFSLMVIDRA